MYSTTTNDIRVTVEPRYLADRPTRRSGASSGPTRSRSPMAAPAPVQILARHWIITDQNGRREDVRGIGVVGEQPVIEPGSSFTYTSGCPLTTPSGTMVGTYQAVDDGRRDLHRRHPGLLARPAGREAGAELAVRPARRGTPPDRSGIARRRTRSALRSRPSAAASLDLLRRPSARSTCSMRSREQEQFSSSDIGSNTRTPRSWKRR